jgi:hypothetical protein
MEKEMTYREKQKAKIHSSHELGKEYIDIRCPGSTPRFYGVRECKLCGVEMIEHPAGLFIDENLFYKCPGMVE